MKSAATPFSIDMDGSSTLILSCSARAGGNSDRASEILSGLMAQDGPISLINMRGCKINPCLSCGSCLISKNPCPAARGDDSEALFSAILKAEKFLVVSPVYFYHLPGILKIFIDRAQYYYALHEQGAPELVSRPWRSAAPLLISGREKGEKLFEGGLLTLDFFMRPFHFSIGERLLLRGLDWPSALRGNREMEKMVMDFGRLMAKL